MGVARGANVSTAPLENLLLPLEKLLAMSIGEKCLIVSLK